MLRLPFVDEVCFIKKETLTVGPETNTQRKPKASISLPACQGQGRAGRRRTGTERGFLAGDRVVEGAICSQSTP